MNPFYGWGSAASRLGSLRGCSLLFTNKFPEIPGTYFIDLWFTYLLHNDQVRPFHKSYVPGLWGDREDLPLTKMLINSRQ